MKKIYLIDGNSFIYRMFFALPPFSAPDGTPVNAIFGMAKLFLGQLSDDKPDYLIFVDDAPGENFRHKIYGDYKATRDRMPDDLRIQMPLIKELIQKMGIPIVEIPGYEADDTIGTLATKLGTDTQNDIYILSGDKDLYSLTSSNVKIYDTMKKKVFDDVGAYEKFGVQAHQIIDYLAIVGDSSDNIPGIPGFGPKKAVELLAKYQNIEEIFEHIDDEDFLYTGKTLEKLMQGEKLAILSKQLATIKKDVDIGDFCLDDFVFQPDTLLNDKIKSLFLEYNFKSLYQEEKKLTTWKDLKLKVQIISQDTQLEGLYDIVKKYDILTLDTETTSLDPMQASLVGISLYLDDNHIYYINFAHEGDKISKKEGQKFIDFLFQSDFTIVGHNIKYDIQILTNYLVCSEKKLDHNVENIGQRSLF